MAFYKCALCADIVRCDTMTERGGRLCCASCAQVGRACGDLGQAIRIFDYRCRMTDHAMAIFHTLSPHNVPQFQRSLRSLDALLGAALGTSGRS